MKPYYQDKWVTIYHGDCREVLPQLDVKVDLVLTDPPWNKDAQILYEFLGNNIDKFIKDDGYCALYAGSNFIQSVLNSFSHSELHYQWTFVVLQLSSDLRYFKYKIHSRWRPIMVFGKNNSSTKWSPDVIKSIRKKQLHEWQEGEESSLALIEKYSDVDGLILDPFLGSGTTCFCAKKLNRYSIGIEIEEKYCEIAARRCSQEVMDFSKQ